MSYIEMFIAPVPVGSQEAYLALSRKMAEIHRENGALEIMECWGNDVPDGEVTSLPMAVKMGEGETVACGWIRWPSKEVRDAGFEKMMNDPRMGEIMSDGMPFDGKRLIMGGFDPILEVK